MKIATDIIYQWSAGEVCFDCPCGRKEIILSEGGEQKTCECGKTYKVHHFIELIEPGHEDLDYYKKQGRPESDPSLMSL